MVEAPTGRGSVVGFSDLEKAILVPIVYASLFGAPVRRDLLRRQIPGVACREEDVERALMGGALSGVLRQVGSAIWLQRAVTPEGIAAFAQREAATQDLLRRRRAILSFVRRQTTVRLAALSGGCAHDAAHDSDIDLFVVTEPGALWRTLLWCTLVAKARGWRRVLCLNFLVDATAQALPWQDFYAGFEVISLKPISGGDSFHELLDANPWVQSLFPNFLQAAPHGQNPGHKRNAVSRGHFLEATARMIHRPYLRRRLPRSTGIELSDHVVRLHATDHRPRLRALFRVALSDIGLEALPWI